MPMHVVSPRGSQVTDLVNTEIPRDRFGRPMIMQTGGKFIVLDRYLTLYGPETQKTREELKASLQAGIDTMWPSKGHGNPNAYPMAQGLENVYHAVVQLKPENDTQRQIQSQCVQVCNDLVQMRWQLVEQT